MKCKICLALVSLALLLPFASWPGMAAPQQESSALVQWQTLIEKERTEKDAEFKNSATSPMAAVQRFTVMPGRAGSILEKGDELILVPETSAAALVAIVPAGAGWRWEIKSAAAVTIDDRTVRCGRFTLGFYPGKDHLGIILFDPQADMIRSFSHLNYFPPDPAFAVAAKLEKAARPERIILATTRGLHKEFFRFGVIRFILAGKKCQMIAFKSALEGEDGRILFIPFQDATTGKETYGVGRFLEIAEPEEAGFVLDFNLAFNPLCNYSIAYNCPRPPPENVLPVAVRAGELPYGAGHD